MLMLYTRALIGLKSVFTQELYIIVQIVYLRIRSDPRREASASLFVMHVQVLLWDRSHQLEPNLTILAGYPLQESEGLLFLFTSNPSLHSTSKRETFLPNSLLRVFATGPVYCPILTFPLD